MCSCHKIRQQTLKFWMYAATRYRWEKADSSLLLPTSASFSSFLLWPQGLLRRQAEWIHAEFFICWSNNITVSSPSLEAIPCILCYWEAFYQYSKYELAGIWRMQTHDHFPMGQKLTRDPVNPHSQHANSLVLIVVQSWAELCPSKPIYFNAFRRV